MKKTTITMLCLAACFAAADTKITWLADVTADRAEIVTGVQSGQVANAAAHIVRTDNPHGVTAPQIGALTNETDTAALAALAAYAAYCPRNATASSWFTFTTNSGAITITGYNIEGGTDVVIPDYINGLPVTVIGGNAFYDSGVTSIGGAGNVVTVGDYAFANCYSLTSVLLPQVQTVGDYAFYYCAQLTSVLLPKVQTAGNSAFSSCVSLASVSLPKVQTAGNSAFYYCISLTSVLLPQVQTAGNSAFYGCGSLTSLYFDNHAPAIGAGIFADIPPNQVTIYVTNPQATGWGATLGGMPVVRLPLYADAIYQAGELVATTGHVAQASLADAEGYTTQMVMRVGSEITTNRWVPRVTLPDGVLTNGMSGVEIRNTTIDGIFTITPSGIGIPFWYMNRFDNQQLFAFQQVYNAGSWDLELLRSTAYGLTSSIYFGQRGAIGINYTDPSYALDVRVPADLITPVVSPLRLSSSDGNPLFVVSGNGDVVSSGTNTAAEVRTLGGYSIFDSGSNCYWRVTASNGTFYASDTNGVRTIDISPAVNSIVRGVSVSSTNILVSSTNSVYYVALDNAANIGFDFSALSLGGTKRADITAVIDCLNTQALYSVINTNLVAMDCPWEPTVTGRYELAVSSDGVRTAVRQVWPQVEVWRTLKYIYAPGGAWVDSLQRFQVDNSSTNSITVDPGVISPLIFVQFSAYLNVNKPISFEYGYASVSHPAMDKPSVVYGPFGESGFGAFVDVARPVEFGAETTAGRLLQVWIGNQSPESIATVMFYPSTSRARDANALERAAYNAGSYPAAFRLDY